MEKDTVDTILQEAKKCLKNNGVFIQYQYWMVNKKDVERYFMFDRIELEPRNFTPAWVYVTKKI
jgi:phospholipid N-methyltransferase